MGVACAASLQTPEIFAPAGTPTAPPTIPPPDAAASYHFMLGYQAEIAQNMDRAIEEYQAALKTDPTSQSVKARLAGLYFSLGDMPNAVVYADQAAEGPSQDGQLLTQLAGILASAGQGERAVKLLDRVIDLGQAVLDLFEILVEAEFENIADRGVIEIVTEPAGQALGVLGNVLESSRSLSRRVERMARLQTQIKDRIHVG